VVPFVDGSSVGPTPRVGAHGASRGGLQHWARSVFEALRAAAGTSGTGRDDSVLDRVDLARRRYDRRVVGPSEAFRRAGSAGRGRGSSFVKVESLDHIHIYAAEPEESARFYQDHFEAKPVHRNANINGDTRIFLALGGQIVVVGSFPSGLAPGVPPEAGDGAYSHGFGVAHFGLRVADVRAAVAELSASGVGVLSQPAGEPSGLTYAYVAAPDGVVVELTQYDSGV